MRKIFNMDEIDLQLNNKLKIELGICIFGPVSILSAPSDSDNLSEVIFYIFLLFRKSMIIYFHKYIYLNIDHTLNEIIF